MIVIVMGVSGAGKSTIGEALAAALGAEFAEGDAYHPAANIEKMRQGIPLTDADRIPWLDHIANDIDRWITEGRSVVLACSALKDAYRQRLGAEKHSALQFVYLRGTPEAIASRLGSRGSHFMPPSLLASQFEVLEEPIDAIFADITQSPEAIVKDVCAKLNRPLSVRL